MTAIEHIIAWIESDRTSYERLLLLETRRKVQGPVYNASIATEALGIVTYAYRCATAGGDMFKEDHTPATLLDAAKALLEWELEQ